MLESWFQANLQIMCVMFLFVNSWEDSLDEAFTISGLTISCVSVLYGLSTFNLRKILRTEPNIRMTLLFTLTELCTSTVIFLYIPAVWSIYQTLLVYSYEDFFIKTVPVLILFTALPILGTYQLSLRMLTPKKRYFCQDYRMNFCLKCQDLDSLPDMVISRRKLVIINIIYVLVTTSAVTIGLYCINLNPLCKILTLTCEFNAQLYPMVIVLSWYTACILSFLQNTIELLLLLITKKSFLDWAFKAGLEELARLARLRERKRLDELEEYNLWGSKITRKKLEGTDINVQFSNINNIN